MTADTDVGDANLSHLSTANFDRRPVVEIYHMDRLRCRLGNGLNYHIVWSSIVDSVIQKTKFTAILANEYVFKGAFADLTLQVLPDVWIDNLGLLVVPLAF